MGDLRNSIGGMLCSQILKGLTPFEVSEWASSSVIIAPHPDDETLGCGGVVHKMAAAGARIEFVFVTDGAASHPGLFAPEALRDMREKEAIDAAARLGVSAERVTFLRFPDGRADRHVGEIAAAIAPLLERWRPRSVFVTHAQDPLADHVGVNRAVREALAGGGRPTTVFEYPIWYWYHWPWVRLRKDAPGMWRKTLRQTIRTVAGLRAISTFNCCAYVGDVLAVKRDALAAHVSQTMRPEGRSDWLTLADLSDGDFLACLLSEHEIFTRYEVNAARPG